MKKLPMIVMLVLIVSSCTKLETRSYTSDCLGLSEAEKNTPNSLYQIRCNYLLDDIGEYYIWKRYGVSIGCSIADTCFYLKSKEYYLGKLGNDSLQKMYNDLDSLDKAKYLGNRQFNDGVYSVALRVFNSSSNSKIAKVIDYEAKNNIEDSIRLLLNLKGYDIQYWYVIGSSGQLKDIEVINQNSNDTVKRIIFNKLKRLKWDPAIYKGQYVDYREKGILHANNRLWKFIPLE